MKAADDGWDELFCRIIYRQATHSWRVVGHERFSYNEVEVCGHGSLRRARKQAREWLREHSAETSFEKVRL